MTQETEYPIASSVTAAGVAQMTANIITASAGVPAAFNTSNPNAKIYNVAFDGTGNNKDDPTKPTTNSTA
jgi:hypothetical protein